VKKTCKFVEENLSAYIDGALNEAERNQFEQELSVCSSCRQKVEFTKAMILTAQTMPKTDAGAAFKESLHEKLLHEQNTLKTVKKSFTWRSASGLVAVAAIFALSFITISNLPKHPELTSENLTHEYIDRTESEPSSVPTIAPKVVDHQTESKRTVEKQIPTKTKPSAISKTFEGGEAAQVGMETAEPKATSENDHMPAHSGGRNIPSPASEEPVEAFHLQNESKVNSYIMHYSFEQEGSERVAEILSQYDRQGDIWLIPIQEAQKVEAELQSLSAFVKAEVKLYEVDAHMLTEDMIGIITEIAK